MIASRALIEARLGREPQDMLEAAVVLEAWAGVPAQRALETGRRLMPRVPAPAQPSATPPPAARRPPRLLLEGAAFLLTVPAIAFWAAPLAESLGTHAVERALRVALPLALSLQWMLHSRYLGHADGPAELARRRWALLGAALALAGVPLVSGGGCTGLLALTWTAGSVLVRLGWGAVYAALVLVATVALLAGADALAVVGAAAAATALAAFVALRPPRGDRSPARRAGGRGARTAGAGVLGAGLGALLVADPSVSWTAGSLPALALLPSAAGGFAGAGRLWRLQSAIPRALCGVVAGEQAPRARGPLVALAGAVGLLVAVTATGSAALLALTPWLGSAPGRAGVLAGFGLVALATLLAGLLESLGRQAAAVAAVLAAALAELAVRGAPFAGAGLVAGGAIAVAALIPVTALLLARPDRTLATCLWIQ